MAWLTLSRAYSERLVDDWMKLGCIFCTPFLSVVTINILPWRQQFLITVLMSHFGRLTFQIWSLTQASIMLAFHNQRSVSKSVFDKKAINICVVFDDGMGPPRLAWPTWWCPGISEFMYAMQKVRLRAIEGRCVCSKKPFDCSRQGSCWEERKRKMSSLIFVHQAKRWFFYKM